MISVAPLCRMSLSAGFFFSSRRRHTRSLCDWSSDVCSSDLSFHMWRSHLSAWLDRRIDDMISTLSSFGSLKIFDDPEAIFQEGWLFCDAGDHQRGLEYMQRGVARGYFPAPTLTLSPQFDPLRGVPAFQLLVSEAEAGRQRALA